MRTERSQAPTNHFWVHWQNASTSSKNFRSKSIAKSLSRKYSASNGLAAKGLHFSHPHRELSIERDLTLLSIGVAAYAWDDDSYSS